MISNISMHDFLKIDHSINIIDTRSVEKYNSNHILGAINVPYEKLILNPSLYLNRLEPYYIYCQKGLTSPKICSILLKQGYHVININGGYEEWMLEKDA